MNRRNEGQGKHSHMRSMSTESTLTIAIQGKIIHLFEMGAECTSVNKKQFHDMTMNNNWNWTTVLVSTFLDLLWKNI